MADEKTKEKISQILILFSFVIIVIKYNNLHSKRNLSIFQGQIESSDDDNDDDDDDDDKNTRDNRR